MAADTQQTVVDLINQEIVANGNNEITADVLRPVLLAMLSQVNDLIGDPTAIPADTLVEQINDVEENQPSGVTIYSGTADPNVTPPASFALGDFYQQTSGPDTVGFYQFNGTAWARQNTVEDNNRKAINPISAAYTVADTDYTIIYTGTNAADIIQLPDPADYSSRILKVVNRSANNINFDTSYIDTDGSSVTLIVLQATTEIQSDGTNWNKIN